MTALQVFGQVKSDSVLVSRIDLIKQIELNDKRNAQWDYCVDAVSKADSVVFASTALYCLTRYRYRLKRRNNKPTHFG
jgi:hypothetical protein